MSRPADDGYAPRVAIRAAVRIAYACALAGRPCAWISSPGVGKTALARQIADALGIGFSHLLAPQRNEADIGGVVHLKSDDTVASHPIAQLRAALAAPTLLLLDEISAAPAPVRGALLDLLATRRVDGVEIHPGSFILACFNPPDECPDGAVLEPAMRNRFPVLQLVPDRLEVCDYFSRIGAGLDPLGVDLPPVATLTHDPSVLLSEFGSLGRLHPAMIELDLPPLSRSDGHAWASPRAWEIALRSLAALRAIHAADPVPVDPTGAASARAEQIAEERALLTGMCGRGPASTYAGILHWSGRIPAPDAITADPAGALLPDGVDGQLASVGAILTAARRDCWAAYAYAARLRPEIGAAVGAALAIVALPARGASPHERAGRDAYDRIEGDASARAARLAGYRAQDAARGAA